MGAAHARALGVLAFALVGLACGGGDDADADESNAPDEHALTSTKGTTNFDFHVDSTEEKAGQVDLGNAYWAARLADAAYDFREPAELRATLEAMGIEVLDVVSFHAESGQSIRVTRSTTGTDAFYLRTGGAGFLVFRGSEDGKLDDAIADLRVRQVRPGPEANAAGTGYVHSGFAAALQAVWQSVRDKVVDHHAGGDVPLYVIGHSLGGGLASLAAQRLLFDGCYRAPDTRDCEREHVPVTAIYTFGSPRIGDQDYATNFSRRMKRTGTKLFRFVNEADQISMLPRYSPALLVEPYRHPGELGDEREHAVFLDRNGNMAARRPRTAARGKKRSSNVTRHWAVSSEACSAEEHRGKSNTPGGSTSKSFARSSPTRHRCSTTSDAPSPRSRRRFAESTASALHAPPRLA